MGLQKKDSLKIGDRVLAEIIEVQSPMHFVVSINGALLRVQNQSSQKLSQGHLITVEVTAIQPLRLRVPYFGHDKLDRRV